MIGRVDGTAGAADGVASWVGRSRESFDTFSPRLLEGYRATVPLIWDGTAVPLGAFWCLSPDVFGADRLGDDGHPARGVVLPPVPFERRMWAGGELTFHGAFEPGDTVRKVSTISDITEKSGRSGRLAFVTVEHAYHVGDRLVLSERQDIVYRDAQGSGPSRTPPPADPAPSDAVRREVATDPVLLFRYSALTFNGHRIHYDAPYAQNVEGYDGLVVHGPLQATVLLNLAAEVLGRVPTTFGYRGKSPLICGAPFAVEVAPSSGGLSGRCLSAAGATTFSAAITG